MAPSFAGGFLATAYWGDAWLRLFIVRVLLLVVWMAGVGGSSRLSSFLV